MLCRLQATADREEAMSYIDRSFDYYSDNFRLPRGAKNIFNQERNSGGTFGKSLTLERSTGKHPKTIVLGKKHW